MRVLPTLHDSRESAHKPMLLASASRHHIGTPGPHEHRRDGPIYPKVARTSVFLGHAARSRSEHHAPPPVDTSKVGRPALLLPVTKTCWLLACAREAQGMSVR